MEIKLIDIILEKKEEKVFDKLNLTLPSNKVLGLYGDKSNYFIDLLLTKDFDDGIIENRNLLKKIYLLNNYDSFITSNLNDECYLMFKKYAINYEEFCHYLEDFNLDATYMLKEFKELSSYELKVIKFIFVLCMKNNVVIIKDLFNNLDYTSKKLFIKVIKRYQRKYHKLFIIIDKDIDSLYSLVDKFVIVDTNLVVIDTFEDIMVKDNFDKIDIMIPNMIRITDLVKEKGINIKYYKSINRLLKEVKENVS